MSELESDAIAAIEQQWRRERPDLDLAAMVVFGRLGRLAVVAERDRLESAGYVRRVADAGDRRAVRVALTDAGRELVDIVVTQHAANETRMLAALTAAERRELDRIAGKLLTALESGS